MKNYEIRVADEESAQALKQMMDEAKDFIAVQQYKLSAMERLIKCLNNIEFLDKMISIAKKTHPDFNPN